MLFCQLRKKLAKAPLKNKMNKTLIALLLIVVLFLGGLTAIKIAQKIKVADLDQADISQAVPVPADKVQESGPVQTPEVGILSPIPEKEVKVEPVKDTAAKIDPKPISKPNIAKEWLAPAYYDFITHLIIRADGTYQEYESDNGADSYKNHGKWSWSNDNTISLVDDELADNNSTIAVVDGKLEGFEEAK